MSWTGSGRRAAVLCTAAALLGTFALPAQAAPALPSNNRLSAAPSAAAARLLLGVPRSPEVPSPEEIAAARSNESATAEQVSRIDRLLADAAVAQEASFAASLQANNAYGEALVELQLRSETAELAAARAAAAGAEQQKTRKQIGQLAGDLYRNGGLNPALSTFVSGNGQALQQAATLEAVTATRSRAFQAAETAALAAESLTAAAAETRGAADDAARTAESRKAEAQSASDAQRKAVAEAQAQRILLVDQLASLKNTTVALESARVDALDRQRQEERLAAIAAAAAESPQPDRADSPSQVPGSPRAGDTQPRDVGAAPAPAAAPTATQAPAPTQAPTSAPAPDPSQAPEPMQDPRPAPAQAPAPAPTQDPAPAPAPARTQAPEPTQDPRPAPAPAPTQAPAPAPRPAPVPAPAPGGSNKTAISVALSKVGAPYFYQYGGTGARGFDCSGLVQNAFNAAGKNLPRTAAQQFAQAPVHVPISQARPGDLLVWGSAPGFYHVAIYLGGGRVVQALSPDDGITVTDLAYMSGMRLHPYAARY